MIEVGSDFSGIGAFNQALIRLGVKHNEVFACDMDKYARKTFIENYGAESDKEIVNSKEHDAICDEMVRYVNAKKLIWTDIELKEFLAKVEVLARSFSFYYPLNVNHREIPKKPLSVYMTSPPCQGFSMAGKRKGSNLFMNSLWFIQINKPRYFIFENVKGLLSHDKDKNAPKEVLYGRTFNLWLNYLGGKSINGCPVFFPFKDSVPYHIYHGVLNAKDYGIPQNRERVFIIGIRNDEDNFFQFPPPEHLTTKLKDVLELNVPKKYYLSDEMIKGFIKSSDKHEAKGTGFTWQPKDLETDEVANCLRANAALSKTDNSIKVGYINQDSQASTVFSEDAAAPTLSAGAKGSANGYVRVKSATPEGYEIAKPGVFEKSNRIYDEDDISPTLTASASDEKILMRSDIKIAAVRGSNTVDNNLSQTLEVNETGVSNSLTTVQKDNYVVEENIIISGGAQDNAAKMVNVSPCLTSAMGSGGGHVPRMMNYQIRRLTPRECIRLMNFPDSFKLPCSDTQTYKQAGNSIVVKVLMVLIDRFKL